MRFSALAAVGLACVQLAAVRAPALAAASPYFCGSAPPGWVPPWQRKPVRQEGATCHLMLCDRRRSCAAGAEPAS